MERKPQPKFKAVLFDMDGTLADTDLVIVCTYLELFKKYRPNYRPTLKQLVYFSGPALTDVLKEYFPGISQDQLLDTFRMVSTGFYEKYVSGYPHTQEMLEALRAAGVKTGIVTNKLRSGTDFTLGLIKLEKYFDFIVGLDEVKNPKPDPEGIYKCADHFGIKPEDILYVGDTIYDYEVAKRAGTKVCLVTWNLREIPADAKPDYYIKDYLELSEVVLNGK